MDAHLREEIIEFVRENIVDFHQWRIDNLNNTRLHGLLKSKNPYLFRAKNLIAAPALIEALMNARLSSSEEGVFGKFLEELAIFVAEQCGGGQKSGIDGIDVELVRDGTRYLIAVKSGKNWGNSQSHRRQREDFRKAMQVIKQSKYAGEVQPVLGICYGNFKTKHKGDYLHIGGQSFWHLLSSDPTLYIDIVEPLGHEADKYDKAFEEQKAATFNRLIGEFIAQYCDASGTIDWNRLVEFVSGNIGCEAQPASPEVLDVERRGS